jgi:hypothetical protein
MAPFAVVLLKKLLQAGRPLVCNEHALVLATFSTEPEELAAQSDSGIGGVVLAFKEKNSFAVRRICVIGSTSTSDGPAEHGNIRLMVEPGAPGNVYTHVSLQQRPVRELDHSVCVRADIAPQMSWCRSEGCDAVERPIPVLEADLCTLLSSRLEHESEEVSFEAVFISRLIPGRLAHDWRKKLADSG